MEEKRIDIYSDDLMTNYHDLANAIVARAADDYREVTSALCKRNLSRVERYALTKERKALLRFLNRENPWYSLLTNVDPEYIIERIDRELGI